jgi:hypothetical protein
LAGRINDESAGLIFCAFVTIPFDKKFWRKQMPRLNYTIGLADDKSTCTAEFGLSGLV